MRREELAWVTLFVALTTVVWLWLIHTNSKGWIQITGWVHVSQVPGL